MKEVIYIVQDLYSLEVKLCIDFDEAESVAYDMYDPIIAEIDLDDIKAIKYVDESVLVDVAGFTRMWVDVYSIDDDEDFTVEFNQYIFHLRDSHDLLAKKIQVSELGNYILEIAENYVYDITENIIES